MTALEAVAKAICANFREFPTAKDMDEAWRNWSPAMKAPWERAAIAAIAAYKAAIREPTKEMMAAGIIDTHKVWFDNFDEGDACEVFQAMLDKAE